MNDKPIYLSGLNGIRAIAALGVFFSHLNLSLGFYDLESYSIFGFKEGLPVSWQLGEHGVTMFFVLSGFLITFLLLKEKKKNVNINLKMFYMRRILRIWPLYYFYLLVVLIFAEHFNTDLFVLMKYVFFLANVPFVQGNAIPQASHLWSIAVEEQFYIFWPFLFIFFSRLVFLKNAIWILMASLAIFRIVIWYLHPFSEVALFSLVNRFDCMMLGGIGAILLEEKSKIILLLNSKIFQVFSWLIFFLLTFNKLDFFNSIIEVFLVSFSTLTIIIGQINIQNRIVNLENPILSEIGKLSFGIYVYHPIVLYFVSKIGFIQQLNPGYLKFMCVVLSVSIFTFIISKMSYLYLESYFLKLKTKYSVVKSTNKS